LEGVYFNILSEFVDGRFFISTLWGGFVVPVRQLNTGLILSLLRLEKMPPIKR
jgi:hypothetical protein